MTEEVRDYMAKRRENDKKEKLARYKVLNSYIRKQQIVFAGSSLMEQFPITEFIDDLGIPLTIYNRGIGGYTTEDFMNSLDTCVYALEPRTLVLSIGSNDLNGQDGNIEKLIENCCWIIKDIRSHFKKVRIIWLPFYPVNRSRATEFTSYILANRTNELIREVNERLKRVLTPFKVEIVELNDLLEDKDGNLNAEYTIDGIHMYANGYRAISERLLSAIADRS